ncbi:S-adenosyl-L-methionine-dependent methyltransferase [Paraphysoderma sedebokerense]|nr:S-adenosyl-L-methionine-dependent methyltransferase [Paraphysoderma sedebokerense]
MTTSSSTEPASVLTNRKKKQSTSDVTTPLEPSKTAESNPQTWIEKAQEYIIDNGLYTDSLLRFGIRQLLKMRLSQLNRDYKTKTSFQETTAIKWDFVENLIRLEQIALHTDKANEQHYMVDTEFFKLCLGPRLKYSSCLFPPGVNTLEEAEVAMFELYCQRAELVDGMDILDLGCGWGSLCLFLCERYPNSRITAISNSSSQRLHIETQARKRGYENLEVVTADINEWNSNYTFDRIMSVEMIEHTKNIQSLFQKLSKLLKRESSPEFGTPSVFIHVFCHKSLPYHFITTDDQSWMARYFFSGGMMPSHDLFMYFQNDLTVAKSWAVNGKHYGRTSREWLRNMDKNVALRDKVMAGYGLGETKRWWNRWRVFYLAVEELFNYNDGEEWMVGHYLLRRKN